MSKNQKEQKYKVKKEKQTKRDERSLKTVNDSVSANTLYNQISRMGFEEMTEFLTDGDYKKVRKQEEKVMHKLNQHIIKQIFLIAKLTEDEQRERTLEALRSCGIHQGTEEYLSKAIQYVEENQKPYEDRVNQVVIGLSYKQIENVNERVYDRGIRKYIEKYVQKRWCVSADKVKDLEKNGKVIEKQIDITYDPEQSKQKKTFNLPLNFADQKSMYVPSSARTEKEGLILLEIIQRFRDNCEELYNGCTLW